MKNENLNRRNGKVKTEEWDEGVKIEAYLQSYLIKFDNRTASTLNYCMLNVEHAEFAAIDCPLDRTHSESTRKHRAGESQEQEKEHQTI